MISKISREVVKTGDANMQIYELILIGYTVYTIQYTVYTIQF